MEEDSKLSKRQQRIVEISQRLSVHNEEFIEKELKAYNEEFGMDYEDMWLLNNSLKLDLDVLGVCLQIMHEEIERQKKYECKCGFKADEWGEADDHLYEKTDDKGNSPDHKITEVKQGE